MKTTNHYQATAPGRICLFGDHQDYLQLPVIACAINRYIKIVAKPNNSNTLHIHKKDLNERETIVLGKPPEVIAKGDFLRLAIRVVSRYNCVPNRGFDIEISGDVPINAGLSSSSALTVAWIRFLLAAYSDKREYAPLFIAKLAFETEVLEQGGSGGKMDQFTIAMGGMIYLNTDDETVETFSNSLGGLIIGVSGVSKDTDGTLATLKKSAFRAIAQVEAKFPNFDLSRANADDLVRYLPHVEPALKPIFEAAVLNHLITQKAKHAFRQNKVDPNEIGDLINQHHRLLRDNLKITVPIIDAMIDHALLAGAYGAKIVGSGGGGCIVALVPVDKKAEVIAAIKAAGAIDAFSVSQSNGAGIEIC